LGHLTEGLSAETANPDIEYGRIGREICAMLFNWNKQVAKPPQCPDCEIDMQFLVSGRAKRVFVSTLFERALFLCPNCQRISHRLVWIPQGSARAEA
jgi:hypothetical protein